MGDGQTKSWKELLSVSVNINDLNSNKNSKTTEGEKHNRASQSRDCMEPFKPITVFTGRKQGSKRGPEGIFEKAIISPLTK